MTIVPFKRFQWHDIDLIAEGLARRFPDTNRLEIDHDDLVAMILQLPGFTGRGRPDDDRILDMVLWRWIALKNPDMTTPDDEI